MKCILRNTLIAIVCIYGLVAFGFTSVGIAEQGSYYANCKNEKYNRLTTYSSMKYFHKLGCWLGEDVE